MQKLPNRFSRSLTETCSMRKETSLFNTAADRSWVCSKKLDRPTLMQEKTSLGILLQMGETGHEWKLPWSTLISHAAYLQGYIHILFISNTSFKLFVIFFATTYLLSFLHSLRTPSANTLLLNYFLKINLFSFNSPIWGLEFDFTSGTLSSLLC